MSSQRNNKIYRIIKKCKVGSNKDCLVHSFNVVNVLQGKTFEDEH